MIALLLLATANIAANTDAALAAIRQCAAAGQSVSVAVVGKAGEVEVLLRGDDASPHSLESARRKAYTAMSFGKPTAELAELATQHPDFAGLARLDEVLFVGGGVPVIAAGHATGGIGVAGSNGPGIDEGCARAALARLQEKKGS